MLVNDDPDTSIQMIILFQVRHEFQSIYARQTDKMTKKFYFQKLRYTLLKTRKSLAFKLNDSVASKKNPNGIKI